jgi:hypothetical protein
MGLVRKSYPGTALPQEVGYQRKWGTAKVMIPLEMGMDCERWRVSSSLVEGMQLQADFSSPLS